MLRSLAGWILTFHAVIFLLGNMFILVILHRKKMRLANGLFYYPVAALLFFAIGASITFTLPAMEKGVTGLIVAALFHLVSILLLQMGAKRRFMSHAEEQKLQNLADKAIASFIIRNKLEISFSDIQYIENSDLTFEEKQKALQYAHASLHFNEAREARKLGEKPVDIRRIREIVVNERAVHNEND